MKALGICHGVYGLALLLIFTDLAYGQCKNTGVCACHCPVCTPKGNCTSCLKGWSGTVQNNCQRRNIAFQQETYLSKSPGVGRSAVDGDPRTFIQSTEDLNPYFTITLDNTYAIKYIYIDINLDRNVSYSVYVSDTSVSSLTDDVLCHRIVNTVPKRFQWIITCPGERHFYGNQVSIYMTTKIGRLLIYEFAIYQCSTGTYGYFCEKHCSNCLYNHCDDVTGQCLKGCKSNWFGEKCDRPCRNCTQCKKGFYFHTSRQCLKCPLNCSSCTSESRCTECLPTFTGHQCDIRCNEHCIDGKCNIFTRSCNKGCNNQKYGVGCYRACPKQCLHCFAWNNCTICKTGFFGKQCFQKCPVNCHNCSSVENCYKCKEGYFGKNCEKICPSETAGGSCVTTSCDPRCSSCDDAGECSGGCKTGWYGQYCNSTCSTMGNCLECDQTSGSCTRCIGGRYGQNCSLDCENCLQSACNLDGECVSGCIPGFYGRMCKMKSQGVGEETQHEEHWTYIIAGLVGVSLFLLVALVVVIVRKKRDQDSLTRQLNEVTYEHTMNENHTNEHLYDSLENDDHYETIRA